MISHKDFQDAHGNIDWKSYRAAEIAAGERCSSCDTFIYPGTGHPTECADCKTMRNSNSNVYHNSHIRCPACSHVTHPYEADIYEVYQEGDHLIRCEECDHEFMVSTSVKYTFESPEILETNKRRSVESVDDIK